MSNPDCKCGSFLCNCSMPRTVNKQYFFTFAQGSYSDYGVNGLFVCDHEVTKEDWHKHYKIYQDECERLNDLIPKITVKHAYGSYEHNDYDSVEQQQKHEWEEINNPEETFQKLHNMQQVEYTEFWRDC